MEAFRETNSLNALFVFPFMKVELTTKKKSKLDIFQVSDECYDGSEKT